MVKGNGPVAVFAAGEAAAGAALWRAGGQLHVTVVVKATFALQQRAAMRVLSPQPLRLQDEHHDGDPARGLKWPHDMAPYLGHADVVMVGSAHAPAGSASMSVVRLALQRGAQVLLDKALYVYGPRARWESEPQPFSRIPLDYRYAYGGPGTLNPVGVGAGGAAGVPNLIDARQPLQPSALGAIAPHWPSRRQLMADDMRARPEAAIWELPAQLDWGYFQAAPFDQRMGYLQGDEWLSIAGVHPQYEQMQSQLPRARAEARVWSRSAEAKDAGYPVALHADMLVIDADALRCNVTWRGSFGVQSEEVLDALLLVAGVSCQGAAIDWAGVREQARQQLGPAPAAVSLWLDEAYKLGVRAAARDAFEAGFEEQDPFDDSRAARDLDDGDDLGDDDLNGGDLRASSRGAGGQTTEVDVRAVRAALPWERPDEQGRSAKPGAFAEPQPPAAAKRDDTTELSLDRLPGAQLPWERAPIAPRPPPPPVDPHAPVSDKGDTTTLTIDSLRAAMGGALPWELPPTGTASAAPTSTTPAAQNDSPAQPSAAQPSAPQPSAPQPSAAQPSAAPPSPSEPPLPPWMRAAPDFAQLDEPIAVSATGDRTATADQPLTAEPAPFPLADPDAAKPLGPVPIVGAPWTRTPAPAIPGALPGRETQTLDTSLLQERLAERPRAARIPPPRDTDVVPQINPTDLSLVSSGWQVTPPGAVLSVIAKAICSLKPGAPARLRPEPEFPSGDIFVDDDPAKSLLYASDYAITKQRADITVCGHVYAPGGSATHAAAGFRFGRGETQIERRLVVFGERTWDAKPQAPFTRMPLTWERALGGAGFEANPVGRGMGQSDTDVSLDTSLLMPNLEEPEALILDRKKQHAPICFAPISPSWPVRARKMGSYDEAWARERAPYLPPDFDLDFFQSAPAAQQIPYPRGDEPYELWAMHPEHPRLSGSLPGLRVRCFMQLAHEAGGRFIELPLHLDTVAFDVDDMAVRLVWRGLLETKQQEAPEIARLFLQTEPLDSPPITLDEARQRYIAAELALHAMRQPPGVELNDEGSADGLSVSADPALAALLPVALDVEVPELPPPLPVEERPTQQDVQAQLDRGAPLSELSLLDADLSGMDLSGAELRGALLLRANLRDCLFDGADLTTAQLGRADLTGASLRGANLSLCDLSGARLDRASFEGAQLNHANFSKTKGEQVRFDGCSGGLSRFTAASLPEARFEGVQLDTPDFSEARLRGASFEAASLRQARFFGTRAMGARFDDCVMPDASMVGAELPDSTFLATQAPNSVWERAKLDRCDFSGAEMPGVSLVKASCDHAIFTSADLRGARLHQANFTGASMMRADLMEAAMQETDFSEADLSGANLYGTAGHGAKLTRTKLDGAITEGSMVFGKPSS